MVTAEKSSSVQFELRKVSSFFTKNLQILADEAEKDLQNQRAQERKVPLRSYIEGINTSCISNEE